ncbi:FAD-dependent oxidoreductase [[Clostridium] scindens]|uniref:FAD-dependent oxidoreductase n=1 Tax=Clostridium scindens (strain JCM 10418 / VPI 12708) TaxID=29347 RepID=UPI0039943AFC
MQNPQGEKYGRKIAVVGGGPGGLSCAFYLQQRGYDVTVFEKNDRPGGMLVFGIPAFRLEKDVVEAEIEVLRQMGVEFRMNTEVGRISPSVNCECRDMRHSTWPLGHREVEGLAWKARMHPAYYPA